MYYLDDDGACVPVALADLPDSVPPSRQFACVLGASKHPGAVPMTPIKITVEPAYHAADVIAANWNVTRLQPSHVITLICIDA